MSRLRFMWSLLAFAFLTGCSTVPASSVTKSPNSSSSHSSTAAKAPKQNGQSSPLSGTKSTSGSSTGQTPVSTKPAAPSYPVLSLGNHSQAVLKLQQELAQLHYLPLSFSTNSQASTSTSQTNPVNWTWTYANTPAALKQFFIPGTYTVLVEGAVMSFERVNGLATDGIAGAKVWQALSADIAKHQVNPYGYSYVYVTKSIPERLILWHDGTDVLVSNANTGIAQSPTPNGTWPVYLRYQSQTMKGTNPNGTHYSDPGVPYVNYFYQGDAVHGFIRSSYGYPQSLGCVELPIPAAKQAWNYIHYGTLVTVTA